jgi:phage gp36-like protein
MALQFIAETDFKGILGTSVLTGLKGANSENLIESELRAISELDPLKAKYDLATMLAKQGIERHAVLIRILVHITAYYLYNTVPDDEIPQRIVDNWKKELLFIKELASGKASSTLDVITDETTGEKVTSFRWGSNAKRSHDLY